MSAKLPLVAAVALLAVSPAASAWNVLKNPDFSGGATPWNLSSTGGGDASYESFFGSPAGGSLRLQSYNFNATSHADQCVDIGKWMVASGYAWSYRFRRNPGPYRREEARARSERLGLWREADAEVPRDFRVRHGMKPARALP